MMAEKETKRNIDSNKGDVFLREENKKHPMEMKPEEVTNDSQLTDGKKPVETVEDLKLQLDTLMNSLATLSSEKSKMEANFQTDRKQLRIDREQYEKKLKDLKEKFKKMQTSSQSEMEHLKYKLILERHEKEKEQAQHVAMMKELQRLISEERRIKEQLETQIKELKNQASNRTRDKILEAELEIVKNKLKQAEASAKGTSPLLLSLQAEMAAMKRQHRNAIQEEQKRVAAAEEQARIIAMTHESRVAGLESRLTELSKTVGGYDRLRLKDQHAIQKLKEQLSSLQNVENKDSVKDPKELVSKIQDLLSKVDKETYHSIIESFQFPERNEDFEYKSKYESLLQEFEDHKNQDNKNCVETGQLHRLKTHCKNLEERIRVLNVELGNKDKECKQKLENLQQAFQEERLKVERSLSQKDNEFRGRISVLEQQILRQRERSLAVINEKEQEIHALKSSFQALMPKKRESDFLSVDNNPPMLHYSQELARREVQVSGLRKRNTELEAVIRDKEREFVSEMDKTVEEIKNLRGQIERLEACQSREGANLEYLKNVFVNYLVNTDSSSKRHMLNAISTVLRFTSEEMEKIRR